MRNMKKIRFIAVLLLLAMLLPLSVSVCAYGISDSKLIITHINAQDTIEGAAVVLSGETVQKVGDKGNFASWSVYIFDWDAEQACFVLTDKNTNSSGADKSGMEIPDNGFAYCICVGTDYSANDDPDDGNINYINDGVKYSNAYAKALTAGTKAYLYGTNLYTGSVKNNGKDWYADDFVSDSYLMIGTPDEGKNAYDPTDEMNKLPKLEIKTKYVNSTHYLNGDCILFDASFGSYVKNTQNETYTYDWWKSIVCDWDPVEGCYTVISVDTATGTGKDKAPVIPANGFVLMDNWSAYMKCFNAAFVGMKVYLYKDGEQYRVLLNQPDGTQTPVTPANADSIKPAPVLDTVSADGNIKCTDGYTLTWNAVEGAQSYTVSINRSDSCTYGAMTLEPTVVTEPAFTVPSGILEVGGTYTLTVRADNSASAIGSLLCVSEEQMDSSLVHKTVLAFGDILTENADWVDMLSERLGTEVINAGVSGDTSASAIARLSKDVLSQKPDIVLLCLGMNDQAQDTYENKPNISLTTYTANMEAIISAVQAIGADVVLIAPHGAYAAEGYFTPGEDGLDYAYGNMKAFTDTLRVLATQYNCGLIDIYAETQDEDMSVFLNAGDGIRQSPEGHALWAEYISAYLFAAYDGKNKATVTVEYMDENGILLESYVRVAAIGSAMYIPVERLSGRESLSEEQFLNVEGDVTVTYLFGEKKGMRGDLDCDGEILPKDYILLKRFILGTMSLSEEALANADIDLDGNVVAKDYMILKRFILGTIKLPEE